MGNKAAKPILDYETCVDLLRPHEKLPLDACFYRLAKSTDIIKGKIDKETFIDAILRPRMNTFPRFALERLFVLLDLDSSGFIEYKEFITAMFIFMYAQKEDRYQLIFNMYDLDGNGQINKKEFKKVAVAMMQKESDEEKMREFSPLVELFVASMFDQFDRNSENFLTPSKFRRYAEEDDLILKLMEGLNAVGHAPEDIKAAVTIKQNGLTAIAATVSRAEQKSDAKRGVK